MDEVCFLSCHPQYKLLPSLYQSKVKTSKAHLKKFPPLIEQSKAMTFRLVTCSEL